MKRYSSNFFCKKSWVRIKTRVKEKSIRQNFGCMGQCQNDSKAKNTPVVVGMENAAEMALEPSLTFEKRCDCSKRKIVQWIGMNDEKLSQIYASALVVPVQKFDKEKDGIASLWRSS